jgi:hypothetical protein
MPEPPIKSRLESTHLTTKQTPAVQQRLSACLAWDPQHITPGQKGDHVKAIQDALEILRNQMPSLGLLKITDPPGTFGQSTSDEVLKYKRFQRPQSPEGIKRAGSPISNIVGRMTITQIDNDLMGAPKPTPPPPEPPPPLVGTAGMLIGPVGPLRHVISNYYNNCGLETIGPGQVVTGPIGYFSTLEELIDLLLARPEFQQVIANHGHLATGLSVPCAKETNFQETGLIIGALSDLADMEEGHPPDPTFDEKKTLHQLTKLMRVTEAVVFRIVHKLVALRKKPMVLHFRACHLDTFYATKYKKAFGALMTTYHSSCSIVYALLRPAPLKPPNWAANEFRRHKSTFTDRFRLFQEPTVGLLSDMLVGIEYPIMDPKDRPHAFIDDCNPEKISGWATFLLGRWKEAMPKQLVIPVMWDDNETTFHCPREAGWRQKLQWV